MHLLYTDTSSLPETKNLLKKIKSVNYSHLSPATVDFCMLCRCVCATMHFCVSWRQAALSGVWLWQWDPVSLSCLAVSQLSDSMFPRGLVSRVWKLRHQRIRLDRFRLRWELLGVHVKVAQSCPTLSNPMDCGPPGSSVHGIPQARILEWVAIPFSRNPPNLESDVGLLHFRRTVCHLIHQGNSHLLFKLF